MRIFFFIKKHMFFLYGFILVFTVFAQNTDLPEEIFSGQTASLGSSAFIGIWENKERFISFNPSYSERPESADKNSGQKILVKIVLKPFYGYYYDGIYPPGKDIEGFPFAVFAEGLYPEFWTSHRIKNGIFWRPENNKNDFTIETVPIYREIAGYYTSDNFKNIYKIRYWRTKVPFSDEKAELRISSEKEEGDFTDNAGITEDVIRIDKYIQIGETVYTCAAGRRTYVRNPEKLSSLPENARIGSLTDTADGSFLMVFGEPLFKKSAIADLQSEIVIHNSIVYPPRNGRASFTEPSIFKKLETMGIEDFYNIRARVK